MLNLTDPVTGDTIEYFGTEAPTQQLANELIGSSIIQASQSLMDGSYKYDSNGAKLDTNKIARKLERNTALQLRVPVSNIDATSGISDLDRGKLGLRPTPGQKLEYLRSEYGYDNVQAVPVDGKYRLMLKSGGEGKDAKYKFVNEVGLDFGDIAEFGATAAIPIIVSAAIVTKAPALAAPLATAGWGSSVSLASISAASYLTAGVVQDSLVAAYDHTGPDLGEIIPRRATEAAISFLPEVAIIRGGQWLSGFAGQGADLSAQGLRANMQDLRTTFTKVLDDGTELVPNLQAGLGGLSSRAGAAAEKKASANSAAIRKLYQNNIDELDGMLNALNGGSPRPIQEVVQVTRDRLTEQLTRLSDDLTAIDPQLAGSVQKILQTKLKGLGGSERAFLKRPTGEKIQTGLQKSFNAAQKEKRKLFDDVTAKATSEGIFYDVDSVLGAMKRAISKGGSGLDEIDLDAARAFATAMEKTGLSDEAVLKALRDKLPLEFKGGMKDFKPVKTMSYKQLDSMIKKYAERADFGDIKAVKSTAGFAKIMRTELVKVRDKAIKGTETQKTLKKANKFYREEYGRFLRTNLKPLIKPDFGSGYGNITGESFTVKGGVAVVETIFNRKTGSEAIKDLLEALPKKAPTPGALTKSEALDSLRTAYMAEIGLNGTVKLGKGMRINVDNDILSLLYPRNWEVKKKALEQLSDLAGKTGKIIEVEDDIFREILTLGTPTQAKNAQKIAERKIEAAAKIAKQEQNKLFQAIVKKQGTMSAEDATEAVGSLLNYSSDEISALVKVIQESSPEFGLATLRNKLSTEIVELARPTKVRYPVTSSGKPLFDSDIMLTKLKDVKIRKVAIEVLGKEWVDNMEAIANVAKYSTAEPRKLPGVRPVISPGSGGMQTTFVVGDLLPDVSRFLYGRFAATPGLKQLLTRKTPQEAALVFRQWLPLFMATEEGLKALALYSRDHPEMSVYLQEELANLGNLAMEQDQAAILRGEMNAPDQSQGN